MNSSDRDNVYYLTDEYCKTGRTQDEQDDDLKGLRAKAPFREVFPDPPNADRIAAIEKGGFTVREGYERHTRL
jgi:hypothetical protein